MGELVNLRRARKQRARAAAETAAAANRARHGLGKAERAAIAAAERSGERALDGARLERAGEPPA